MRILAVMLIPLLGLAGYFLGQRLTADGVMSLTIYMIGFLTAIPMVAIVLGGRREQPPRPTRAEIDASLRDIHNSYQQRPQTNIRIDNMYVQNNYAQLPDHHHRNMGHEFTDDHLEVLDRLWDRAQIEQK